MYCRSASIAIIVFDLTNSVTFDRVEEWYDFVRETAHPMFIIAGNKLDLEPERSVDEQTATDLASRIGCRYVEVSARTGEGMNAFGRAIVECAREFISHQVLGAQAQVAQRPVNDAKGCRC
jgi:GTPase SAR1 family protein